MKTLSYFSASVLAVSLFVPSVVFAQNTGNPGEMEYVEGAEAEGGDFDYVDPSVRDNQLNLLDFDANLTASEQHNFVDDSGYVNDSEIAEEAGTKKVKNYHVVDEDSLVLGHGMQLGMAFVGVPGSLLDNWFAKHGNTWDDSVNMGFSLDYYLRFKRPCELKFSLSWVNAHTGDAYWLDDNNANHLQLADYITHDYSIVSLEVAAYQVVSIIDEIAFYYGGGAWVGATMGNAKSYAIRSSCANTADDLQKCPHEPGSVTVEGIPPVFGFVVATVGFKFTLFDMMTIRAEGGFKGYLYGQLGVGVEF